LLVFLFLLVLPGGFAHAQSVASTEGAQLQASMPLGGDSILLEPAKQRLNMLATVECKDFEKIKIVGMGRDRKVLDLDGNPLRYFPRELIFRFTIGARTAAEEQVPYSVETRVTADQLQSNLRFRLKAFHGVDAQDFEPVEAKMIGVPAQVPYDERIYRIAFKLPDISVEDRMVLEVLDESGNRIAKFHLQLM
jgi:hypothetical protein